MSKFLFFLIVFVVSCNDVHYSKENWVKGDVTEKGEMSVFLKQNDSILLNKTKDEIINLLGKPDGFATNRGLEYIFYEVDIKTKYQHEFRIYFDSISDKSSSIYIMQ